MNNQGEINLDDQADYNIIKNNTIYSSDETGIGIFNADHNHIFHNNIIYSQSSNKNFQSLLSLSYQVWSNDIYQQNHEHSVEYEISYLSESLLTQEVAQNS